MSAEILAPCLTVAVLSGLGFLVPAVEYCGRACQEWLSLEKYKTIPYDRAVPRLKPYGMREAA